MIIGISGKKGSGKDTFVNFLQSNSCREKIWNVKFSEKVKEIASILAINYISSLDFSFGKEKDTGLLNKDGTAMSVRQLLQKIGTEFGREAIQEDIWAQHLFKFIDDAFGENIWAISDVRFPNEAEEIKSRCGTLIRINSDRVENKDTHKSECALDHYEDWDFVIDNSSSLQDLELQAINVLRSLNLWRNYE